MRGVAAGLLTPFDSDLEIEHSKLREDATTLYDSGIQTFLVSTNISEYHSLTREERIAVTESGVEALPSDACVLAGAGGGTFAAQNLVRAYDRIGVDGIMVMVIPPDHAYVHEQGLIRYYEKLAEETDRPQILYVKDSIHQSNTCVS